MGEIRFYFSSVASNGDANADNADTVHNSYFVLRPQYVPVPGGYRREILGATLPAGSIARGISNDGRIVGTVLSRAPTAGFLRAASGAITTIEVPGATSTHPMGVNNAGAIVGYAIFDQRRRGFLRSPDGSFRLFDVAGSGGTEITAIRDDGEMVGTIRPQTIGRLQGVRLTPALAIASRFPGYPLGLNQDGATVGASGELPSAVAIVFLQTAGGYTPLLDGIDAIGLNDRLDVVAAGSPPFNRATLRPADGRILRLSDQDDPDAALGLYGINNRGEIVGRGRQGAMRLVPCPAAAAATRLDVPPGGGEVSVIVNAEAGCHWIHHIDADWVTLGGWKSGTAISRIYVAPNPVARERSARLTLGDTVITVHQSADPLACIFTLGPSSAIMPATGAGGRLAVYGPAGCVPSIFVDAPWIELSNRSPASFDYFVAENRSLSPRFGSVRVGNALFAVRQEGGTCAFQVEPAGPSPLRRRLISHRAVSA